jgi:hypothetical protein
MTAAPVGHPPITSDMTPNLVSLPGDATLWSALLDRRKKAYTHLTCIEPGTSSYRRNRDGSYCNITGCFLLRPEVARSPAIRGNIWHFMARR